MKHYLIWLDYRRANDWNGLARPRILPRILAPGERPDDASKKLLESARSIASVASSMITMIGHGGISVGENSPSIQIVSNDYATRVLHPIEKKWFEDRETADLVIDIIRKEHAIVLSKPWSPLVLPRVNLDLTAAAEAVRMHTVQIDNVVRTATAQLVRRHQGAMGEVIQREGITPAELTVQGIRCAFGYNISGAEGCTDNVAGACGTCSAQCCQFHLDHELHKDVVSDSIIFRQQQALAQQKLTMRTPAVAPAKESASVEPSASEKKTEQSASEKKARKNTWMDLEARYEKSKGQPYKRPPGQKVTDFQLMVEGLEGRQRREPAQEPAQAKNLTRRQEPAQAIDQTRPPVGISQASAVQPALDQSMFQQFQQYQQFLQYQAFVSSSSSVSSSTNIQHTSNSQAEPMDNGDISDDSL